MKPKLPAGFYNMSGVLISLMFCASYASSAQTLIRANQGVYDLTHHNFSNKNLALSGYWHFVKSTLLNPEQCIPAKHPELSVPSLWNDQSFQTGIGYGTYHLHLVLPADSNTWSLYIPQLYSSYHLWINDSLFARNGTPGSTRAATVPQWRPQCVTFKPTSDTVKIVLQLANFHHHKGGIRETIYLGKKTNIESQYHQSLVATLSEIIIFTLLAVGFITYFFIVKRQPVALFYSLLCLSWALRSTFSDLYPITMFYPDFNWTLMVRIEYISLFLIMIFSVLFLNHLFPEVSNPLFEYTMVGISILFILFTLVTDPTIFTRWLILYLIAAILLLCYGVVVIARAVYNETKGGFPLVIGVILIVLLTGYNIIAYERILESNILLLSVGYILIFSCVTVGVLQHLGILKTDQASAYKLTYNDLYKKKEK